MTTTAAQLSFFFFLIQNTSLVLFEVVIQLFFWASCEVFFFRELFDKYQETWSVLYLMNNKTLTESLKNIKNPKQMIKRMFPKSVQR